MIRLEKREDKSGPGQHEFYIYHHRKGGEERLTGRAFFLKIDGDDGRWMLNLMERQKINPNHYDDYPNLSQEAITALVGKARELGIKRFFLERRKHDPEEFHDFLRELGFREHGLVFEISLDEREPFDWGKVKNAFKRAATRSHRLAFWKK